MCTLKPGTSPAAIIHPHDQSGNEPLIRVQAGGDGASLLPPSAQEPGSKRTVAGTSHTASFMAPGYISDALKPWKHTESIQADLWVSAEGGGIPGSKTGSETLLSTRTSYSLKKKKEYKPTQTIQKWSTPIGAAFKCLASYLPHLMRLILSNESILLLH